MKKVKSIHKTTLLKKQRNLQKQLYSIDRKAKKLLHEYLKLKEALSKGAA